MQTVPIERDALAWVVDISTVVVGITAIAALVFGGLTLLAERRRHDQAWHRQIALDHHARIYEAAADLNRSVTLLARRASDRVQARGTARVDHGYAEDADETVDPAYAALLDQLGGTLGLVAEAHDDATRAVERLWFLIPRDGVGELLLEDLVLVRQVLDAIRPTTGREVGRGSLESVLDGSGLRQEVEMLIATDGLSIDHPVERIKFVQHLAIRYLTGRIGRFVAPPPLAANVD